MRNNKAFIAPTFYLFVALFVIYNAMFTGAPASEMKFPMICTIAMLLALIPVYLQAFKGTMEINEIHLPETLRAMGLLLMLVAYVFLLPILGFVLCSFLMCVVTVRYLGYNKWLGNILFSVGVAAFVYVVFKIILRVPVPIGSLWG